MSKSIISYIFMCSLLLASATGCSNDSAGTATDSQDSSQECDCKTGEGCTESDLQNCQMSSPCPADCPDNCDDNGKCPAAACPEDCPDNCDENGKCPVTACPEDCPDNCDENGKCPVTACPEDCPDNCTDGVCSTDTFCPDDCPDTCDDNGECPKTGCPAECPDNCTDGVCNTDTACPDECPDTCDDNGECPPAPCPDECPNNCTDGVCNTGASCPDECPDTCSDSGECPPAPCPDECPDNCNDEGKCLDNCTEGESCRKPTQCTDFICKSGICTKVPRAKGTVCREAKGVCDIAETCDGQNLECPADAFASSDTVCRKKSSPCDLAEKCTGKSGSCPADKFDKNCTCPADGTIKGYEEYSTVRAIKDYNKFVLRDLNQWDAYTKAIDDFGKGHIFSMTDLELDRQMKKAEDISLIKHNIKQWEWNKTDQETQNWKPQGLAGLTVKNNNNNTVYRIVAWFSDELTINQGEKAHLTRISIINMSKSPIKYRHALLVNPITDKNDKDYKMRYKKVSSHAGGMAAHWPYLYVAQGDLGIYVFDLRRFIEADTSSTCEEAVGMIGKKLCARGYGYLLPRVGYYRYPEDMHYTCHPKFSSMSLDYVGSKESILSGEYRCSDENKSCPGNINKTCKKGTCEPQYSRMIRWPMNKSNGRLVTNKDGIVVAEGAWYTGSGEVQGVASYTENNKTTFFLNGAYYHNNGLISSGVGPSAKLKRFKETKREWYHAPEGMYITTKGSIWSVTESKGKTNYGSYKRILFYVDRKDFMP